MSQELQFDAERHEYRVGGVLIPSVTTIIAPLYDFSGIPLAVMEAKRALGTAVHTACEYLDDGDLDESTLDEALRPYVAAYQRFKHEVDPHIATIEQRLHHKALQYAGTLDRLMNIDGKWWVVDLKTTASLSPAVGVQLAAYAELVKQQEGGVEPRRAALQLMPSGEYKFKPYADPMDRAVFLSLLTVHNWSKKNGL